MSQESVEVARAAFDAWNAGDMDRLRDMYDPNVVGQTFPDWPEPGPYVGREAIMRGWEQMRATFDADELEPISDFIDSGDRVAVRLIWRGAGKGPELNMEMTNVITVRNGRIVGLEYFWDHTKALATMGLAEWVVSQANVEVVKAGFDAWNAGDMDRLHDLYDPNVVLHMFPGWPEPGPYAGREAVMREMAQLRETWDADVVEPISFVDVGDRVVVRQIWRGFRRGLDANIDMTIICSLRQGRIASAEYFWDHAEALEAAGLSE